MPCGIGCPRTRDYRARGRARRPISSPTSPPTSAPRWWSRSATGGLQTRTRRGRLAPRPARPPPGPLPQAKGRKIPESPGHRGRTVGNSHKVARSRYALWKNPDDLNRRQRQQLEWIAKTDPRLWRAYLLKEGIRYVFAVKGAEGKEALDRWLSWARRSQLPSFVYLAKRITKHREAIEANLEHGLSQGLIESTNTKIRLLTRIAFGFHGPQPLIALALLALGSHPPQLPGRN